MAGMIYINDVAVPYPKRGLKLLTTTAVTAARNADAEVVGQKVGRDQYKLDSLVWPYLDAETWSSILKQLDQFYVMVKFPDQVNNNWKTVMMYPGDRSAEPYWIGEDGLPTTYINCKVNLIDCGVTE